TNAGTYASDSWTFSGGTNYKDQGPVTITDSIAKANPNCSVTPYSVTYDAAAHSATGSCAGVAGELTPLAAINFGGTTHTNAATYATDSWSFTDTSGNYLNDGATITDSIAQADAVCTVTPYTSATTTYNASAHSATGSCTGV